MIAENLASVTITKAQSNHFHEHGFVKLPGLLNHKEVSLLRLAMTEALTTFSSSPNAYNVTAAADAFWRNEAANDNQSATQHDLDALAKLVRESRQRRLVDKSIAGADRGRFLLDTSVWRRTPSLADFALMSSLPEMSAGLLGAEAVRFYDDQLFVKEPGAVDRAAFHQDFPYFHLSAPHGCVFWIPLDFAGPGGGRLAYIPGSHQWGDVYKPNIFVSALAFPGSEGSDMPAIDENPEAFGATYIDVEPGDVLVHHFLTIHGSEGNSRSTGRRAFSLRYCDASLTYRKHAGAPLQPLHRQGAKDGDALDPDVHPVVWPRPRLQRGVA
jgi:ectoine hydroxylase-related dioxygenase (phytanoyl-CoA dioxygenase family)